MSRPCCSSTAGRWCTRGSGARRSRTSRGTAGSLVMDGRGNGRSGPAGGSRRVHQRGVRGGCARSPRRHRDGAGVPRRLVARDEPCPPRGSGASGARRRAVPARSRGRADGRAPHAGGALRPLRRGARELRRHGEVQSGPTSGETSVASWSSSRRRACRSRTRPSTSRTSSGGGWRGRRTSWRRRCLGSLRPIRRTSGPGSAARCSSSPEPTTASRPLRSPRRS